MNFGLNNIEAVLYREYTQQLTMKSTLEAQIPHPSGGIVLRKSKAKDSPREAYYVYTHNGIRHSKRIHPDELAAYQNNIATLKEREAALIHTKEELIKIRKCMKSIHFDLTAYEQQLQTPSHPQAKQQPNVPYPEHLRHTTLAGIKVRSKSEALLVNLFFSYHVHFEYEKELQLGTTIFHPDFTITTLDGRIFYWEHLGMTEDPQYARSWARKNHIYMQNGISEGNGLIITRDTNGTFNAADAIFKIKLHNLSQFSTDNLP